MTKISKKFGDKKDLAPNVFVEKVEQMYPQLLGDFHATVVPEPQQPAAPAPPPKEEPDVPDPDAPADEKKKEEDNDPDSVWTAIPDTKKPSNWRKLGKAQRISAAHRLAP